MPAGFFAEFIVENGVAKGMNLIQPNGTLKLTKK
jgi:hypothetical protein